MKKGRAVGSARPGFMDFKSAQVALSTMIALVFLPAA